MLLQHANKFVFRYIAHSFNFYVLPRHQDTRYSFQVNLHLLYTFVVINTITGYRLLMWTSSVSISLISTRLVGDRMWLSSHCCPQLFYDGIPYVDSSVSRMWIAWGDFLIYIVSPEQWWCGKYMYREVCGHFLFLQFCYDLSLFCRGFSSVFEMLVKLRKVCFNVVHQTF